MQRAKCTRFFRRVYRNAPCSNVMSSVNICITNIATIYAAKILAFPKRVFFGPNMIASTTSLASIGGRNNNKKNSSQLRFIFQIFSKLVKAPSVKFGLLCFALWLCCFSNSSQVLYCNSFSFTFCLFDNLFTNSMIVNGNKATFSTTKPFQEFLSFFGAFALNACSYFTIFFTNIFESSRIENSAIGTDCNVRLPEVNFKKVLILPIFVLSLHQNIF